MNMPAARVVNRLMILIAALFLGGCASGPKFMPVAAVPEGKTLIYVYRRFNVGGVASDHIICANGTPIGTFDNASYYPFITSPGIITFSSQSLTVGGIMDLANSKQSLLTIQAESGQTYYAEFHIGDTWGPKLVLVDAETGLRRLEKCRLVKDSRESH